MVVSFAARFCLIVARNLSQVMHFQVHTATHPVAGRVQLSVMVLFPFYGIKWQNKINQIQKWIRKKRITSVDKLCIRTFYWWSTSCFQVVQSASWNNGACEGVIPYCSLSPGGSRDAAVSLWWDLMSVIFIYIGFNQWQKLHFKINLKHMEGTKRIPARHFRTYCMVNTKATKHHFKHLPVYYHLINS